MHATEQMDRPKGFRGMGTWLKGQLLQGRDSRLAAHAAATGLSVGIIPVYGITTIVCGLIGVRAGFNHGILQGFNYMGAPLKVALLLPFMRLGEWVLGAPPLGLAFAEIAAIFKAGPVHAFQNLTGAVIHGLFGWALVAPLVYGLVFFAVRAVVVSRQEQQPA